MYLIYYSIKEYLLNIKRYTGLKKVEFTFFSKYLDTIYTLNGI